MTAQEKLKHKIDNNLHICVGLDSDINKIPKHLKTSENPILEFNKRIIDSTAEQAAAFKINFAFYECSGIEGYKTLEKTIEYIPNDVLIIADAKRGDIGNTSQMYAQAIYDYFKCDSITLHPYMGYDSVEPFLDYESKINFILGLTSNKGANDFEKLKLNDNNFVYQEVINKTNQWNKNNNLGLVFGATNPEELKLNIQNFNDMPILLPGVGAQGGSLEDVVSIFKGNNKRNFIINISRGLIYYNDSVDFENKISERLTELNKIVANLL
ncbi:MAG: orotidine-5'-phosphate decarboxylase [Ignavibacteriae bacterium]|nr:MAG: orotidine-5'-phosphate decarboxylase [Ignavibacteriota bacterium]